MAGHWPREHFADKVGETLRIEGGKDVARGNALSYLYYVMAVWCPEKTMIVDPTLGYLEKELEIASKLPPDEAIRRAEELARLVNSHIAASTSNEITEMHIGLEKAGTVEHIPTG